MQTFNFAEFEKDENICFLHVSEMFMTLFFLVKQKKKRVSNELALFEN
jgi:hypothetical protein